MNDDGVKSFAVAIVKQACEDYIKCLRTVQKHSDVRNAVKRLMRRKSITTLQEAEVTRQQEMQDARFQIEEIENFFRSEWFNSVSAIEPEMLIERLQEMAKGKKWVSMKIGQM